MSILTKTLQIFQTIPLSYWTSTRLIDHFDTWWSHGDNVRSAYIDRYVGNHHLHPTLLGSMLIQSNHEYRNFRWEITNIAEYVYVISSFIGASIVFWSDWCYNGVVTQYTGRNYCRYCTIHRNIDKWLIYAITISMFLNFSTHQHIIYADANKVPCERQITGVRLYENIPFVPPSIIIVQEVESRTIKYWLNKTQPPTHLYDLCVVYKNVSIFTWDIIIKADVSIIMSSYCNWHGGMTDNTVNPIWKRNAIRRWKTKIR